MKNEAIPATLYLDTTEEITAVIDRLAGVPGDVVELVVPAQAALFQSVVNLKLLARAAKRLGKTLTLTTRDETGQHLALQAGIGVRAQLGAPLLEPRATQQRAPAVATIKGRAEDAPERVREVQAPAPVAKGAPAAAPSKRAERAVPATAVTSTGRKLRPIVEDAEDGSKRVGRSAPRVALLPDWPWKKIGIGAGVLAVIGFFLLTFVFASASIKVVPKQQQAALDGEVVVKPSPDASKHEVAGRIAELSREGVRKVEPTGTKEGGTKTTGSVTISNTYSNDPQPFGVNTRLQASGGQVFLLTAQVTVPGAKVDKGKPVAGSVTATVVAEKFGEEYNVGPTAFTFIDLPADQQAGITGQSTAAMSGGTKTTLKTLSSSDVDTAVKSIQDELGPILTGELRGQLVEGEELLEQAIKVETKSPTTSVKVGAETDATEVEIKASVVVKGFVHKPAEVDAVAAEALKGQLPANQSLLDDASSAVTHAFKSVDFKQQILVLSTHAERLAVYNVDAAAIADQVAGKTRGQASEAIQSWPEVERVEVHLSPFWRFHLPRNTAKVNVEVGL